MDKTRRIFKILLLGDADVGKETIRHRYLGESFKQNYSMSIGADFAVKRSNVDEEEIVQQVWDIASQFRFSSVREIYYQGAVAVILVYDITKPHTFINIQNWLEEVLLSNRNKILPMMLVGIKSELRETVIESVSYQTGFEYAESLSVWSEFYVPFIEVSKDTPEEEIEKCLEILIRNIGKYIKREYGPSEVNVTNEFSEFVSLLNGSYQELLKKLEENRETDLKKSQVKVNLPKELIIKIDNLAQRINLTRDELITKLLDFCLDN